MKSCTYLLVFACGATLAFSQGTPQSSTTSTPQSSSAQGSAAQTSPGQKPPAAPSATSPGQSSAPATGLKARGPEAVAQQDPNRVVATIGGKEITAREALNLLQPLSPQDRRRYEANLSDIVQRIYMEERLAEEAAKLSLDQQSPWKEQLQLARANILTQAYLNKVANGATGSAATDPKAYYDSHPDDFDQFKLTGIFVSFSPPGTPAAANSPANKTEEQARQKADDIEKKIKAGGDFSALARTDSDNAQLAAKGGDLGTVTSGDAGLPADIKAAIMKLQAGQVSEPVRLPNGFFVVKVESRTKMPFEQARAAITQRLQNDKNQAAVKQELDKYKIEVKDPDFFNASNGPARNVPSLQKPGGTPVPGTPPSGTATSSPRPPAQH